MRSEMKHARMQTAGANAAARLQEKLRGRRSEVRDRAFFGDVAGNYDNRTAELMSRSRPNQEGRLLDREVGLVLFCSSSPAALSPSEVNQRIT